MEPLPRESLPQPDFDETPWQKYLIPVKYAPIRTAEGCYWGRCTFCGRTDFKGALFTPPEQVVERLEALIERYGVRHISVNDDCLPPSYWEEIAEGILQRQLNLSMVIWAKPVAGFSAGLLQKMALAGVKQIRWGVESAHPRILKLMQKGTTVKSTLKVLGNAHEAGIWNHACFILGFPTETPREAQSTLDFIQANSHLIQSFILNPFELLKTSFIFRHPQEFGIRDLQLEETPLWDRVTFTTEEGMSAQEVESLVFQAKKRLLKDSYHRPFWYYLKLREYLQIYLDHLGLRGALGVSFNRAGLKETL
jgi:radical SAM superfamily enzyme YgiQ (UPF0313 family)